MSHVQEGMDLFSLMFQRENKRPMGRRCKKKDTSLILNSQAAGFPCHSAVRGGWGSSPGLPLRNNTSWEAHCLYGYEFPYLENEGI